MSLSELTELKNIDSKVNKQISCFEIQTACFKTIEALLKKIPDFDVEDFSPHLAIIKLKFLLQKITTPDLDHQQLNQIITDLITLLDAFYVDEICNQNYPNEVSSFYTRDTGHSKCIVLDTHSPDEIIQFICQSTKAQTVSDLNDINHTATKILFTKIFPLEEENAIKSIIERQQTHLQDIFVIYRLENLLIIKGYFIGSENKIKPRNTHQLFAPLSPVGRQDYWHTMLRNGFPVLQEENRQKLTLKNDSSTNIERQRKAIQRRMNVFLANLDHPENFDQLLHNHQEHYSKLFSTQKGERPQTLLTRSGVSANETIISTIADISTPDDFSYLHPGWYYENRNTAEKKLKTTEDYHSAHHIFLNTIPCIPSEFCDLNTITAIDSNEQIMTDLIARAKAQPDKEFSLVIDTTSSPLYNPKDLFPEWPANLNLYLTLSLTKHQRGQRNYFFGCLNSFVSQTNPPPLAKHHRLSQTKLYPLGITHLPRLTRTEIQAHQESMKALQEQFSIGFLQSQQKLPPNHRWNTETTPYFTYLIPPVKKEFLTIKKQKLTGFEANENSINFLLKIKQYPGYNTNIIWNNCLPKTGLIYADSFNLSDSRFCCISNETTRATLTLNNSETNVPFFFCRTAIGSQETLQKAFQIGHKLGQYIAEKMALIF